MISENGLPAIHPGEYLAEMLDETGMSQSELARRIGVSRMCISHIVNGKRPVRQGFQPDPAILDESPDQL